LSIATAKVQSIVTMKTIAVATETMDTTTMKKISTSKEIVEAVVKATHKLNVEAVSITMII
jgi:hypothetical protein